MYRLEDNIFLSEPGNHCWCGAASASFVGREMGFSLSPLQRRQGNHHSPKGRIGVECFFPWWHSPTCSSGLNTRSINSKTYIYFWSAKGLNLKTISKELKLHLCSTCMCTYASASNKYFWLFKWDLYTLATNEYTSPCVYQIKTHQKKPIIISLCHFRASIFVSSRTCLSSDIFKHLWHSHVHVKTMQPYPHSILKCINNCILKG